MHLASIDPSHPIHDWSEDISRIRSAIEEAANSGHNVLVVGHSYGGLPSSEAIAVLDLASQTSANLPGGVTHLFYCCSFVLSEGQSLDSAFASAVIPWYDVSADKMLYKCKTPIEMFYNDLPEEEAKAAVAMLRPHAFQITFSKVTYAAWKHVPSTCLYCTADQAIPYEVQKMMVEEGAKGFGIRTETAEVSHSPFYSKPEVMVDVIRRAAGEDV